MANHYNAFISYRHAPADSRVAGMVQKSLERYRIPRKIQQEKNIRRIARIFRDKEELPITSNLNDDIGEALYNSDYLIVICSTSTHESKWVLKEIETFLKNHTKRQVLTVLVDGEPYDVIPEILCYEDVTVTDPDGTQRIERIPLEPLSCDLRNNPKKAMRVELHRMAATLIGCSFDDLFQRQKKYQRRRRTIILSSVITGLTLLTAYFMWSSIQIRENYLRAEENYTRSLENQSRYLSSQSLTLLDKGDRIAAIQLALAALPSEEVPRPVIPEAEYAMSRALYAYSATSKDLQPVNTFTHQNEVSAYCVVDNGSTLWVKDTNSNLYLWDTQSFTLRNMLSSGEIQTAFGSAPSMRKIGDNRILLSSSTRLRCLRSFDGAVLWDRQESDWLTKTQLMRHSAEIGCYISGTNTVLRIDPQTGETIGTYPLDFLEDKQHLIKMDISDDGRYLVFACEYSTSMLDLSDAECSLVILDLEAGTQQIVPIPGQTIDSICFSTSGQLLAQTVFYEDGNLMNTSSYFRDFNSNLYAVFNPQEMRFLCCDPATGQIRWENAAIHPAMIRTPEMQTAFIQLQDEQLVEIVNITAAGKSWFFAVETGELIQCCELSAPAVLTNIGSDRTNWILSDGNIALWKYGSSQISQRDALTDLIDYAELAGDQIFLHTSMDNLTDILMYSTQGTDPNWIPITDNKPGPFMGGMMWKDRYVCLNESPAEYLYQLQIFDLQNSGGQTIVLKEPDQRAEIKLLGIREESGEALLFRRGDKENSGILRVHLDDGTLEQIPVPEGEWGMGVAYSPELDTIAYYTYHLLGFCNLTTGEIREESIPPELDGATIGRDYYVNPSGSQIILNISSYSKELGKTEYTFLMLSPYDGTIQPVEADEQDSYSFQAIWASDGSHAAITGNDRVTVVDAQGNAVTQIPTLGRIPSIAAFLEGEARLVILYSDYEFCLYDSDSGELLEHITLPNLQLPSKNWQNVQVQRLGDDHLLLITPGKEGILIDTKYWGCSSVIESCYAYYDAADSFITSQQATAGGGLGMIPRYTTEVLTSYASQILDGKELSPEQKKEYGLS